jgi:hypothetical protein
MYDDKADRGSPRGTGRVDTVNVALPQSFHFFYQKYQDFFNFIFHRHHIVSTGSSRKIIQ